MVVTSPNIQCGSTPPGQGWQQYAGPGASGIFIDVNTQEPPGTDQFTKTPTYVISIGGGSAHWSTTGGNAIYLPTKSGFRVYVRWVDGAPISPADAAANRWQIHWIAYEEFA
jgi:hypothetical protein